MSYRRRRCENFTESIISFISNESHPSDITSQAQSSGNGENSDLNYREESQRNTEKFSENLIQLTAMSSTNSILNKTIDLTSEEAVDMIGLTEENDTEVIDTINADKCAFQTEFHCTEKSICTTFENMHLENIQNNSTSNNLNTMSLVASFHDNTEEDIHKNSVISESEINIIEQRNQSHISLHQMSESFKENLSKSVLRRISQEFQRKPIDFTEKLVTILEESSLASITGVKDASGISLSRITEEFVKLCKFIEDESMPEWAPSFEITTNPLKTDADGSKLQENDMKDSPCRRSFYKGTPRSLFRNIMANLHQSPYSTSTPKGRCRSENVTPSKDNNETNTFEFWEQFCDELCEKEATKLQHCTKSLPPQTLNSSTTSVYTICERQLASLDNDSITTEEKYQSADSSKGKEESSGTTYYTPQESFSQDRGTNYDANQMEVTIMEEMRKRRQRCLDFAKLMNDIDKEDPTLQNKEENVKLNSPKLSVNSHLLNTINRCMEYKDILTSTNKVQNKNEVEPSVVECKKRVVPKSTEKVKKKDTTKPGIVGSTKILPNYLKVSQSKNVSSSKELKKTPVKDPSNTLDVKKQSLRTSSVKKRLESSIIDAAVISNKRPSSSAVKKSANIGKTSAKTPQKQLFKTPQKQLFKTPQKTPSKSVESEKVESRKDFLCPDVPQSPTCAYMLKTPRSSTSKGLRKSPVKSTKTGPARHVLNLSQAIDAVQNSDKTQFLKPLSPATYFVTPGKMPERKVRKKCTSYFSDPNIQMSKQPTQSSMEECRTQKVNKLKFQNVVSPLGMYINYNNTNLLQNVPGRINEMLLTPKKGDSADMLKFQLSPRNSPRTPKTMASAANQNMNPAIPSVFYSSPRQVHIIKEPSKPYACRGILESIDNKVILRHEGRVKADKGKKTSITSGDEDAEMSVLVEKAAKKTY